MAPKAKVVAGALGGAVSVILVWILKAYANVELPPDVAAAFTLVVSTIVAYLIPEAAEEVELELEGEVVE